MLTVVPESGNAEDPRESDGSASLIDTIVRDGARRMLAAALQAEVDAYIDQFTEARDEHGRRLVVRNGSHQGPGAPSTTSSWRPCPGSTGSTTSDCTP